MYGRVQRGRRLVRDDEARAAGKGERDQHALAHAARQLMRVLGQKVGGSRQPRCRERGDCTVAPALAVIFAKSRQMLVELRPDHHHRVEGGHRLLRDECDHAAEQSASARRRHLRKALALKQERASSDLKTGRKQLGYGAPDHRLPGTGFANQTENLSGREVEGQPADCRYDLTVDSRADFEVFGLQGEHSQRPFSASRTSSVRRSPSPRRLNDVTVRKIASAGSSKFHGD
jgi:hypothetical protein